MLTERAIFSDYIRHVPYRFFTDRALYASPATRFLQYKINQCRVAAQLQCIVFIPEDNKNQSFLHPKEYRDAPFAISKYVAWRCRLFIMINLMKRAQRATQNQLKELVCGAMTRLPELTVFGTTWTST
jgi:hypothetical protein